MSIQIQVDDEPGFREAIANMPPETKLALDHVVSLARDIMRFRAMGNAVGNMAGLIAQIGLVATLGEPQARTEFTRWAMSFLEKNTTDQFSHRLAVALKSADFTSEELAVFFEEEPA